MYKYTPPSITTRDTNDRKKKLSPRTEEASPSDFQAGQNISIHSTDKKR